MIAGRYELEREVGRGGMGAVWLAQDTVLGRQVAIKRVGMVPGGATPDFERAEREARLAARLNHAHVVAVFDLVTDPEGLWLVMEYVEGSTLAGLVSTEGALPPARATELLVQAADALTAAHEAGIVHRDVKPSNILVSAEDRVKLSDFGIARAEADSSLTQTGLVTGSPAYLAPEVASGQSATDASDVWSLGATLFHALSGRPPYEVGDNLMGTLYKIVHEEPPRLPDAGWLAPLLEATMTRDPADRWSMAQVRDYLAAGPEGARPPAPVPASSPEPTQMMTPVAATEPVTEPVGEPVTTPVAAPAADPASRTTTTESPEETPVETPARRRTPWVLIGVGLVLLAVLLVVAWSLVTGGDDPPAAEDPGASDSPSQTGGAGGGDGGGEGEGEETTPPEEPTQEGMETFIADYLATASSDPATSYERLTPAFQRASGGPGGYTGFWNTIDTAELVDISADPESLTVSYTWAYTRTDGSSGTDDVTLGLVFRNGRYLISEES